MLKRAFFQRRHALLQRRAARAMRFCQCRQLVRFLLRDFQRIRQRGDSRLRRVGRKRRSVGQAVVEYLILGVFSFAIICLSSCYSVMFVAAASSAAMRSLSLAIV